MMQNAIIQKLVKLAPNKGSMVFKHSTKPKLYLTPIQKIPTGHPLMCDLTGLIIKEIQMIKLSDLISMQRTKYDQPLSLRLLLP